MTKTRLFVLTIYKLDLDYDAIYTQGQIKYMAWGLEHCPQTGTQHHQCWVMFINPRSDDVKNLKIIGELFGNSHTEPMRGYLLQNAAYCRKENELHEWGDKPRQGSRTDLDDAVKRIRDGQDTAESICLDDPGFYHQYGRTLHKAEDILMRKRFRNFQTTAIWLWGRSGVGKTHAAFTNLSPETHYDKPLDDKWWDGYTGQETVILNDFRGEIAYPTLLTLIDKWPTSVIRRCREPFPFLSKHIIITSCKPPELVYDQEPRDKMDQLLRRITVQEVAARPL